MEIVLVEAVLAGRFVCLAAVQSGDKLVTVELEL